MDMNTDKIKATEKGEESELGRDIPKLGFGLMRLPMLGGGVDTDQVRRMADLFLERGFTYFDTAYGYIDGKSEKSVKDVLATRHPRHRYQLATKLPAWAAGSKEAARRMFYTSLERTGADYFDFYLLHNLGEDRTRVFEDYDLWHFAAERKKEGLIRHIGFSMHDRADELDRILTAHPEAEFVQLQINYADWESPSVESRKCYETARKHGKPVIIMEPVKGGYLASPPVPVANLLRNADPDVSPASWAIRFAASLDGVITVLSGMSDFAQMQDNLATMGHFRPLDEREQGVILTARHLLESDRTIPCTSCGYCMEGCPQQIAIFGTFRAMNEYIRTGNAAAAVDLYRQNTEGRGLAPASACIACGRCEEVCPQHIRIIRELRRSADALE